MCLPDLDHNWPRYVLPTGTKLSHPDGFLPDPEDRYERYSNPKPLALTEFFTHRCCVLLGDAGIGKSDTLHKEHRRVQILAPQPANVIFRSLREFGSDVTAEHFLASPEITGWVADQEAELFLFLDSLDEALLKVDTWSALLSTALVKWPVDRLWLRITCRSAFWPASLGAVLATQFGNNLSTANLAPLRRSDVEKAAAEHGIQAQELLAEIRRANAATFAARPLTLKMIFRIFTEQNKLPKTQAEMYQQGCHYLASEHNVEALEGHRLTNVPTDRRIVIVERVAAMSVFCNRRSVQHPDAGDSCLPEGTLKLSEICSKDVRPADLREVLASALFSFQSPDILAWTNWSYAEFLAASWCISQNLTTASIRNLISVRGDQGAGIPEQLSSTAIWIGELRPLLQRYLVELNPSLLLFIDEGAVNHTILPRLVKASVERKTTWEMAWQVSSSAHRFKYPGITKQLSKYLRRPRKDRERETALSIAIACDLSELSDDLVALAESNTVSLNLRQLAASAIARMGTDDARKAIRHFATNPVPDDLRDNLKGCALSANWPRYFTITELMPMLTPQRSPNHSGGYEAFLTRFALELDTASRVEDVLLLLRWAKQSWLSENPSIYFDSLVKKIMLEAWRGIDNAAIRQSFVDLLFCRVGNNQSAFVRVFEIGSQDDWSERLAQDHERRTLLLETAILSIQASPYTMFEVCGALQIGPADCDLLLLIAREGDQVVRQKISTILPMLGSDSKVFTTILQGLQERVIDAALASALEIELGSERARQLQDAYGRKERQLRARQNKVEEKLRTLDELLLRSEAKEPNAWFEIWGNVLAANWLASNEWAGRSRFDELTCWVHFDNPTRERIYRAAQKCLLTGSLPPLNFLAQTNWPSWAFAELAALLNTIERCPAEVLRVQDDVWQRWSILALWSPFAGIEQRDRSFRTFLGQRIVPFTAAARLLMDLYIPEDRCSSMAPGLHFNWCPEITSLMLAMTQRLDMPSSCWDILVTIGLVEAYESFDQYLRQECSRLEFSSAKDRNERLTTAISLLLGHAKPGTWTALRNLIYSEPNIGGEALKRAGEVLQGNNWLAQMRDDEVAELYIYIHRQFPEDIGQVQGGGALFGGAVSIWMLRDSALVNMRSRGNLKVFRSILQAIPEVTWLPAQLPYVEEAHFRRRWQVETPEGLVLMALENSVPWFQKPKSQVIMYVVAFLGLGIAIASVITAEGMWRILLVVICTAIFIFLAATLMSVRIKDRRPQQ